MEAEKISGTKNKNIQSGGLSDLQNTVLANKKEVAY
jgi:hypothetical protein